MKYGAAKIVIRRVAYSLWLHGKGRCAVSNVQCAVQTRVIEVERKIYGISDFVMSPQIISEIKILN